MDPVRDILGIILIMFGITTLFSLAVFGLLG